MKYLKLITFAIAIALGMAIASCNKDTEYEPPVVMVRYTAQCPAGETMSVSITNAEGELKSMGTFNRDYSTVIGPITVTSTFNARIEAGSANVGANCKVEVSQNGNAYVVGDSGVGSAECIISAIKR